MSAVAYKQGGRLFLALLGSFICLALDWFDVLAPLSHHLYDLANRANPMPYQGELLIVAIDEQSLQELGQWPWAREKHVELVRRLDAANVRAIAIDIAFPEPDLRAPGVDSLLASAIAQADNVALPVFIGSAGRKGLVEVKPLQELTEAATALGHVHLDLDEDGIARRVYLSEGLGKADWNHFAVATTIAAGLTPASLPGSRRLATDKGAATRNILRDHENLIPFVGASGAITTIPYADIIRNRVPPEELANKVVFVGATAASLAGQESTSVGPMSSVELNANIFLALISGQLAQQLERNITAPMVFLLSFIPLFAFSNQSAGRLLAAITGTLLLAAISSLWLFTAARLWFSPAPLMLGMVLFYPLWSWLHLRQAMLLIRGQLSALQKENARFRPSTEPGEVPGQNSVIASSLYLLEQAYQDARSNQELIHDSLEHLTVGVLLAEQGGRVMLANQQARQLLGINDSTGDLHEILISLELRRGLSTTEVISALIDEGKSFDLEGTLSGEEIDLLCRGYRVDLDPPILLLTLTDVTDIKRLQRERGEALDFLSHDLLAPLNSVLALIENARTGEDLLASHPVLDEIERYTRKNLGYAENYVQLSRIANTNSQYQQPRSVQSIIDSAVAQVYHVAQRKQINIKPDWLDTDIWLRCNHGLLERALYNYLDNAIRYSPPGSEVNLHVQQKTDMLVFCVVDQGPGVSPADQAQIFEAFSQGKHAKHGVGLGLRFVSAVAHLHGGTAWVDGSRDGGAAFYFSISSELVLS